jgi:putative selenium metabolism hydrolase
MLTEKRKNELVHYCQELIKCQSYSGQEAKVGARLADAFKELGFDEVTVDQYGNVIGRIKGSRPGKAILFDGHIDTVPVPDVSKWQYDPFAATIADGRIYGRGASDMKGAVAAMICAAGYFSQDVARDFAGDIYVAGVVHEECFEGVASRSVSTKVTPDYVVIGEASELNLKRGQRGRAEIVVETYGKPAHSANPQAGVNAVYKMTKLIDRIRGLKPGSQPVLGEGILELTDIKSSPYPGASVVPELCRVTYDRRLLVGETKESVLKPLLDIITELEQEDPDFKAKAYYAVGKESCYTGSSIEGERFFPGWLYDEQDEFVQAALSGLRKIGLNPEIAHYSFCTNGSHYAGEVGIKTIGFGPSKENIAHTINEYIELDQLFKAAEGYYAIIKSVLK